MKNLCNDCKFYLPVDVFKGLCKKSKKTLNAEDTTGDDCFEKNKKCKYCVNFSCSKDKENIGLCMGKTVAYPDMIAVTCKLFKQI